MAQMHRDIKELRARIELLETRLDAVMKTAESRRVRVNTLMGRIRGEIVRIQSIDETEHQFIGVEFSLGSKLKIPGPPRSLRDRKSVGRIRRGALRKRDLSMIQLRKAFEEESEADVIRRGGVHGQG